MSDPVLQSITPPPFLDVATLLEASQPPPRINYFWSAIGMLGLLVVFLLIGKSDEQSRQASQLFTIVVLVGMVTASIIRKVISVRRFRVQQQTVESIEEMMLLRRWEPAGILLNRFLSTPVRTARLWSAALVHLAGLLGRYHRFEDAITVQNFIIDHELLDDQSDYFMRLGRAMSMLREDKLVDADRAIGDLRRRGPEGGTGGLALVEMFRDVKTGHPGEAIQIFSEFLPAMRQQLGHRVADAHALAAKAYDLLGDESGARIAYQRATLLSPVSELHRRYPELLALADKYPASIAPREVA